MVLWSPKVTLVKKKCAQDIDRETSLCRLHKNVVQECGKATVTAAHEPLKGTQFLPGDPLKMQLGSNWAVFLGFPSLKLLI